MERPDMQAEPYGWRERLHTVRDYISEHLLTRRVGGAMLVATMALGLSGDASEQEHALVQEYSQPVTSKITHSLDNAMAVLSLTGAANADVCNPKVGPNDLIETHNAIFGNTDMSDATDDELIAATNKSLDELAIARSKIELIPTPANFNDLMSDATQQTPAMPVETYMKTFSEYVQQFGLQARFQWNEHFANTTGHNKDYYANNIKPLTTGSLQENAHIRPAIMNALHELSRMPKNIPAAAGIRTVVFGDITNPNVAGQIVLGEDEIYIDVNNEALSHKRNQYAQGDIASHEIAHNLAIMQCIGKDAKGNKLFIEDKAFRWLMRGFFFRSDRIEERTSTIWERREQTDISTIEEQGIFCSTKPIIAVRDYSLKSPDEYRATLLGEDILDTRNMRSLMKYSAESPILRQQIALTIARLSKLAPAEGEFYRALLRSHAFINQIGTRDNQLVQQRVYDRQHGIPDSDTPEITARNQRFMQPIYRLAAILNGTAKGGTVK